MAPPRSSREEALSELRAKLLQHKEVDAKVRQLRESVAAAKKEFDKTEDDLKALQSVGQIIGEVLRQLDAERCECLTIAHAAPHRCCLPMRHAHRRVRRNVVTPHTLLLDLTSWHERRCLCEVGVQPKDRRFGI
jgi:ATP-dependent 26S proteasome regulatory subunit